MDRLLQFFRYSFCSLKLVPGSSSLQKFPTRLSFTTALVLVLVPCAFFPRLCHIFLSIPVSFLETCLWFCASPLPNYVPTFCVFFFRYKSANRVFLLVFLFRILSFSYCRVHISKSTVFQCVNDSRVYRFSLDRSHSS